MRPTNPPVNSGFDEEGMPQEYGMYDVDTGGDYDEDDFFYHMYFDEVSTTPLPDEFYDILESVSAGSNPPQQAQYPDYFDYFLNQEKIRQAEAGDETTTEISSRQSKNKRYLSWKKFTSKNQTRPRTSRRNSKYMKSIKHTQNRPASSRSNSKHMRSKRSPANKGERKRWEKQLVKLRQRKRRKLAGKRFGWSNGRGIIGILDRRIPAQFRQAPFVTIALGSFVVLSTGVTTSKRSNAI